MLLWSGPRGAGGAVREMQVGHDVFALHNDVLLEHQERNHRPWRWSLSLIIAFILTVVAKETP
jgi:hypothetical protein